ncbi:MAG: nucleotidyl transferase AbiEii/AbiGii toxin family protein [Marinobacter sp.]|uniref:nucleotidyl transferase AbiEii/AbiGii toxin family protein n=1 Tax=Marinobacter sp. TaxID=50741 RepID=UPI00396EF37C
MKNKDVNLMQLEAVAEALGDLLPKVTFVGGSTTVLLVDEAAHYGVRKTDDVDVIIDVATLVEYHKFSKNLRVHGFREDIDGPNCRWLFDSKVGGIKLDVMPTDERVLGYSNRWYKAAIDEATNVTLPSGLEIRVVSPAYFMATKFEAFAGRGKGNFFSHDLEDIVFIMENRSGLIMELIGCDEGLKRYFAERAASLLNNDFLNVLPGLLNNPDSARAVENSLKIMKSWS